MNEPRPLVAYAFAYVGRQLHSFDELNANAALRRQRGIQLAFEKTSGRHILRTIIDSSTYRAVPFVSREKFRQAINTAREAGADLLLADIQELMTRTRRNRIIECTNALDALDVEIWDASLHRTWRSMTAAERRPLVISAARAAQSRSEAVKAGISLSRAEKSKAPNGNYKKGVLANRRCADQRARRYRDFVLSEMAKLPPGEKLSPSTLATALNAAGLPSARGGRWSHNTAKDLIARVEDMAVAQPLS
ncbi:hypothetical protein [Mesorhizobium koreense]|uniref:hypothetical protein n=1 Tax=Mesorhizobium koreense TaxID=3074855 RepID=UPI00287B9CD4|nr:hypothetical protein [Mesorhizobium sp. WR6]